MNKQELKEKGFDAYNTIRAIHQEIERLHKLLDEQQSIILQINKELNKEENSKN